MVVVDPPRAGLAGKALKRIGAPAAPRIVYVSCNPTTLAGDVKVLAPSTATELERVRPVDMFPHTPHVEAVALPRAPEARQPPPTPSNRLLQGIVDAQRTVGRPSNRLLLGGVSGCD